MTLGGLFGSSSHSQIERSSMRKEEAINPSKRSVYRGKKHKSCSLGLTLLLVFMLQLK